MNRIIVTGASGFLGFNLCNTLRKMFSYSKIFGIVNTHPIAIPEVEIFKCNLLDNESLTSLFDILNPDHVFHLAAISQPNECEKHPLSSYETNVQLPLRLAHYCQQKNVNLTFTSTDQVFDGTRAPYSEKDTPNPINIYGKQKLKAEQGILSIVPNATVCRMPLMFGHGGPNAKSFIQPWIESLRHGEPIKLFTDEFRTPLSAQRAAAGLIMMARAANGILHLGGGQRISRYEFGILLAQKLGVSIELCIPISQKEIKMAAPRPADVSLESSKALSLGFSPGNLERELEKVIDI